ncbi:hypothetical protein TRVL_07158 [Trypanosoma vivax]|nr:hypothetical protein TRVL_07158 [Trypanosoma vivax]
MYTHLLPRQITLSPVVTESHCPLHMAAQLFHPCLCPVQSNARVPTVYYTLLLRFELSRLCFFRAMHCHSPPLLPSHFPLRSTLLSTLPSHRPVNRAGKPLSAAPSLSPRSTNLSTAKLIWLRHSASASFPESSRATACGGSWVTPRSLSLHGTETSPNTLSSAEPHK